MLGLGSNDAILLLSVTYSCIDLSYEWELFQLCQKPIHRWLLVSYACVVAFRLTQLVGTHLSQATSPEAENRMVTNAAAVDFLLDLRQKGWWPRVLAAFSWLVALPFFVLWTLIGTFWLHDVCKNSPTCVPSETHLWFMGLWLALCFVWIGVHIMLGGTAMLLERRVRRAEQNLRSIEDSDSVARWGTQSSLASYSDLPAGEADAGLSPEEIKALPGASIYKGQNSSAEDGGDANENFVCEPCCGGTCCGGKELECAICINDLRDGDNVRTLQCNHTFHRSCIDLWLLRRADCPLCKQSVRQVSV